MIDILSKDEINTFDLNEIQKNAEICIKRINYEIENIKKEELNNIPELPENMKNTFVEYDDVKEFKGFIPKHLPDKISKVVYSVRQFAQDYMIIYLDYYTTYKNLETFRNEYNGNDIENKEEKDEIEEEEKDNDLYTMKIGDKRLEQNENYFLLNFYNIYEKNYRNIQIIDDSLDNNKTIKLSLIRHIFYNNKNIEQLLKDKVTEEIKNNDKSNYFFSEFWNIENIKGKDYCEIFNIYRRNFKLEFAKGSKINHELIALNKNKISYSTESYFHDDK